MGDAPTKSPIVVARRRIWTSELKSLEKLVLLALLEHWSATTETFPSCARLALFTGLSERAVKSSLAALERAGFMMVERNTGRSNRYDLTPLFRMAPTGAPRARVKKEKPVQEMHGSSAGDAPVQIELPVHHVHPTSAPRAPEPVHHVPTKSISKRSNKKSTTATHPNTTLLKTYFVELYTKARGGPPDWSSEDHARVGKAFKQLGEAYGGNLDAQKGVIRAALLDEFSPITDPMAIFKQRDRFYGKEPRSKGLANVRAAPQRGVADHVRVGSFDD